MKNILIISPEPWSGQSVSKHHYAITLASQGKEVYFLNPPNDNIKDIQIYPTNYKHLYTITDNKVAKGLRFYPKRLRVLCERRWLERVEKIIDNRFDTIWLFENSRFYDMGFAGDRLKIYHPVDINQNFHIKEASLSADICFGTSDYIINTVNRYNKKAYKIHHGTALSSNPQSLSKEQEERFEHSDINVVYVGNLDMIFVDIDIDILESLVARYSSITFHLVGSFDKSKPTFNLLKRYTNIIRWGRVDSSLILSILSKCDISLLLYKAYTEYQKAQLSSPHKLMEYLASGKVVVSTYVDEYKDKRELLEMVDDSSDYLRLFESVVKDLDFYNSKDNQKMRMEFAQNHSYPKQLEKIYSFISYPKRRVLFISVDGVQNYLESLFLPLLYRLDSISVLEFCLPQSREYQKYKNQKYRDKIEIHFGRYFNSPPIVGSFVFILYGAYKLYKTVQKENIDILMPRSLVAGAMVLLVKPFFKNIQIIYESDGLMADERVDFGSWSRRGVLFKIFISIEKRLIDSSTYVTTRTQKAKDILISRTSLDKERFVVIPNGKDMSQNIDIPKEQKIYLKEKIGIQKSDIIFIYVGSIGSQYKPKKMIEIFEKIYKDSYKFIILTPNIDEMREIVLHYPHIQNSIYIDSVASDEVYSYLSIADIGVSLREPSFSQRGISPIKIIEYMMTGLPIITNSGVGDLDLLYTKYNNIGYIIDDLESIDYDDIRDSIKRLLHLDKEKIKKIAKDEFDLDNVVKKYNTILEGVRRDERTIL